MAKFFANEVVVTHLFPRVGLSLTRTELIAFRDHCIKRYIPRVWRNFLDFLATKGNADQFGAKPFFPVAQVREASVVIGATHADAVAVVVESNGWRDDNIEAFGVHQ